jgi:hypothetical protein
MGKFMKKLNTLFVLAMLMLISTIGYAQKWDAKQSEVWGVVLASYVAIDKGDAGWTDEFVMKNAMVWGGSAPMPRGHDSVKRWNVYSMPLSKTLVSEYSPTAIVVHESTAVAHYYYSNGAKNTEGKHKTTHGKCTDILVKDGKSWKFIAWSCADIPDKD